MENIQSITCELTLWPLWWPELRNDTIDTLWLQNYKKSHVECIYRHWGEGYAFLSKLLNFANQPSTYLFTAVKWFSALLFHGSVTSTSDPSTDPPFYHIVQSKLTEITSWSRVHLEEQVARSVGQDIPRHLWNPSVHYRLHKKMFWRPM